LDRPHTTESSGQRCPLLVLDNETASALGESPIQLRERSRYEYVVEQDKIFSFRLVLLNERGIQQSAIDSQRGIIEPGDYCGSLPLKLVREGDEEQRPIAQGIVEVRSVKLDYRSHYRGMLHSIGEKSAGLLLDARAATKLSLSSLWNKSSNIVEQQLEFLRSLLESENFGIAIEQILRFPHRRLEDAFVPRVITKVCKPDRRFVRQIASAKNRCAVPESHCLGSRLASLPQSVLVRKRVDEFDTPENRFVVMVIREFRDFLEKIEAFVKSAGNADSAGTAILIHHSQRLRRYLDQQLSRSFFPDISRLDALPFGSPVLHKKAGYREILRIWLEFQAAAQVAWDGGVDVFAAGSRDVATLYEYWLFFQLEELFRRKFNFTEPLHAMLIDRSEGLPRLKLRRDIEIAIGNGFAQLSNRTRRLLVELYYNRRFDSTNNRTQAGSWTRAVRPDYTLTIWPDGFEREEAESQELLVYLHFDAKYRVDFAAELFGSESAEVSLSQEFARSETFATSAKYHDLLKMHAYRDAVRRTAGAYVLYPGEPGSDRTFQTCYHEILPGLGAFAVRPDKDGRPQGLGSVEKFLDDVLEHLSSRVTARERVSYHVAEAYGVPPRDLEGRQIVALPEMDDLLPGARAVPLAEHQVLVAWYDSPEQMKWTRLTGKAIVRLGDRPGAWHIPPFVAEVRHILLHTRKRQVEPGLWRLTRPGLEVYTAEELKRKLDYPLATESQIYAVFDITPDSNWSDVTWDPDRLLRELQAFKSSQRRVPITILGRLSAYPEVLPLANLLRATKTS
jgi:predicted component of viral defense system (DUF524 family)